MQRHRYGLNRSAESRLSAERLAVAEIVKRYRQGAKMSQQDFGKAVGVPLGVVLAWERGARSLYMEDLAAICKALNLDCLEFARSFVESVDLARATVERRNSHNGAPDA